MTNRKKKRKLKKSIKRILFGIISIILIIFIARFAIDKYEIHQLKEIGYQTTSIKTIDQLRLRKILIKRGEYSQSLDNALQTGEVYLDYLDLYFIRDEVTLEITQVYQRLENNGYTQEALEVLFSQLNFRELTPLLVFDFQEDVNPYIEDVIRNRDRNVNQFILTNSYYTPYEQPLLADITQNYNILVTKTYQLPQDYTIPLTNVSIGCRMRMMQLETETARAFESMCADMQLLGMKIASNSGYRDYNQQQETYNSIIADYGTTQGEQRVARPSFSEHETGLAVDIASLSNPDVPFVDSKESDWLMQNAHHYGFILRYQKGYEQITGVQFEAWHYRYVGVELATKVFESGLTFDEYYLLYLKPLPEVNNGH